MSNPLDPQSILTLLPTLIPSECTISSPIEFLALLSHTIFTTLSFRSVSQNGSEEGNKLKEGWEKKLEFKYKHEQSSMTFEVVVMKLGGRGIVNAIAVENDKPTTIDILLTDYFSSSFFPFVLPTSEDKSPVHAFNSPFRLKDFINTFKLSIIAKLIPGLRKEGYSELAEGETEASSSGSGGGGGGRPNTNINDPRPPYLPDEPGPMRPMGGGYVPPPIFGGREPQGVPRPAPSPPYGTIPNVGRSDLEPLGGMGGTSNPLRLPNPGHDPESEGMLVGPNHPLFRERFGSGGALGGHGIGGVSGPWGGDGYLPGGAVPPGARFDPIGPGFGGIGGIGRGRGRGGGGWGDEFPPPPGNNDYDDMFM